MSVSAPAVLLCPACSAPLPPNPVRCPQCALPLGGRDAAHLRQIDIELAAITVRRTELLRERGQVIARLRRPAVTATPTAAPGPAPQPGYRAMPTPAGPVRPRRETSALTAQNILLGLGGLLLAIAAIVFAVVAWSWVGLAGRAAILGLLTVAVGVLPVVLSRRNLTATAETLAQLTILLVLLDGWAAWYVGLVPALSGAGWAAVVLTGSSLVALGLHRPARLRGLPVAALVLTQPVPLLVAAGLSAHTAGWLLAGAALAALDAAIAWALRRTTYVLESGLAVGVALSAVGCTVLSGAVEILLRPDVSAALAPAVALVLCAAVLVCLVALTAQPGLRAAGTAVAALVTVGAVLGVAGHAAPSALCLGVLTVALVPATTLPASWRRGPAIAVLVLTGTLLVAALVQVGAYVLAAHRVLDAVWTGPTAVRHPSPAVSLGQVLTVLAAVLVVPALPDAGRPHWIGGSTQRVTAALLGLGLAVCVPLELGLPWPVIVCWYGLLVAAALTVASAQRPVAAVRGAAAATAVLILVATVSLALSGPQLTLATLLGATLLFGVAAARAQGPVRAGSAGIAALTFGGLVGAAGAAAGLTELPIGWLLVGAAAAAATVGLLLRHRQALLPAGRWVALAAAAPGLAGVLVGGRSHTSAALLLSVLGLLAAASTLIDAAPLDRHAHATGAVLLAAVGLLLSTPAWLTALLAPLGWFGAIWTGAPAGARAGLAPDLAWHGGPTDLLVLVLLVTATSVALRVRPGRWSASAAALGTAGTLLVLPLALDLPRAAAIAVPSVLALAGAGLLVGRVGGRVVSLPSVPVRISIAAGGALLAVSWSLADPISTVVVLTVLAPAAGALAVVVAGPVRTVAVPTCLALVAALVAAAPMAMGFPAAYAAFAVLAVAGLGSLVAVLLRHVPAGLASELTAVAVAVVALLMAAGRPGTLAAAMMLTGTLVGAHGARADRRWLRLAGPAISIVGTWVGLADAAVTVPEAYTLPAAALTLVVGVLRRRGHPQLSSWLAYGPGLAMLLAPSTIRLLLGGSAALRPALAGLVAVAVVLVGARLRQQATLLIGALALTLIGGHEMAPIVLSAVLGLPRWLPLAVVGALLLGVGATYERRRRDLGQLLRLLGRLD